jgi:hypothetical protein
MYSRNVINKRLIEATAAIRKTPGFENFEPEYHSIRQVEANNAHFKDLLDPDDPSHHTFIRPLHPDEKLWIKNERLLSALDYAYWSTRYAYIRNWEGNLVHFTPNKAQQIIQDIDAELEEQLRAICMLFLKARQLGVTTDTELRIQHRVQFYPFTIGIVGSADPEKSAKMVQMMERCWENQPSFLVPTFTKYVVGELMEFGNQNSSLAIQHGSQKKGIGRGDTPSAVHLSECSEYLKPEEIIDASLIRAVHESPWILMVFESTAKCRNDWWHKTWQYSIANWHKGRSRLRPTFLPWYVGRDIYPTETWLRSRPIPIDWNPAPLTIKHAERASAYVKNNELLKKYLGDYWRMPREQMWFWEIERAEYAAKGELHKFYAEMPADDHEAFQSANMSVFPVELVAEIRERSAPEPWKVCGFMGTKIPIHLQPDAREIDSTLPVIKIDDGIEIVPLKFNGYAEMDPMNKLVIWEKPYDDFEYGLGVDTSEGVGMDRGVVEVLRKGTIDIPDAQVAEYASPWANEYDLVPIVHAIGLFYSTLVAGVRKQAKLVIECNKGQATQTELRKLGWSHFHIPVRLDQKKLQHSRVPRVGWYTTSQTRPDMLAYAIKSIRDFAIDLNSPWFIDEMTDLERDASRQMLARLAAADGAHDDRIMSLAMVFFSLHILELRGTLRSLQEERAERKSNESAYASYHQGFQGSDLPADSEMRHMLGMIETSYEETPTEGETYPWLREQ